MHDEALHGQGECNIKQTIWSGALPVVKKTSVIQVLHTQSHREQIERFMKTRCSNHTINLMFPVWLCEKCCGVIAIILCKQSLSSKFIEYYHAPRYTYASLNVP